MIQKIVQYGNPVLRKKGECVKAITPAIQSLIGDLIETMRDAHGIGLAAQQIGHAFQVTVVDVRSADRPSTLEMDKKPAEVDKFMPLVLINPEVKPVGEPIAGAEGCLSFPEIFGNIKRAEIVDVAALNEKGQPMEFRCGGLLARAIQHEVDHLKGILFIDRMDAETKRQQMSQLKTLKEETTRLLQEESV
ncbi:MAG TPA: peptide deformylase [Verrucomicrobiae bacterium]|jgi:peptide deformylase